MAAGTHDEIPVKGRNVESKIEIIENHVIKETTILYNLQPLSQKAARNILDPCPSFAWNGVAQPCVKMLVKR